MDLHLNDIQTKIIKSVLDFIIPPSSEGMPGASIILENIDINQRIHFHFMEAGIKLSSKISEDIFNNIPEFETFKRKNFREFSEFVNLVLIIYYSHVDVMTKINSGTTPPFPEGNSILEGDIYLLEQVFLKDKLYIE
jgi:hypothetical protein